MDASQSAVPIFKHDPLNTGLNIRILILEAPRVFDSVIRCKLIHTPLSKCRGGYDALSYVWGSLDMDCKIYCNGQPFYVNTNCYLALKNLRKKRKKRRILWIDNICIDQSSNEERGHQVELMGLIYQNARTVVVWLGEEEPGTKRAFRRRRYSHFLNWRYIHFLRWNFRFPYWLRRAMDCPRQYHSRTAGAHTKTPLSRLSTNNEQARKTRFCCSSGFYVMIGRFVCGLYKSS